MILYYNNSALGQTIAINYDDVAHSITSGVINGTLLVYLPYQYAGDLVYSHQDGLYTYEVRVQNNSPYAYVVSYLTPTCSVAIASAVVVNSTTPTTQNGTITVNATGGGLYTYILSGGPDNISSFQFTNVFFNLKPGTYNVQVQAYNNGVYCLSSISVVVVGYNGIACDLVLGTVQTTLAPLATLTVVDYTTSLNEPVEYRLDAGAWQDSNVFTGINPGVYNVQIRLKNWTTCTSNRNITVSNSSLCDVVITSIAVTPEQSKFGKNGALLINATSTNGSITYSKDGGASYQAGNLFTGLPPGDYNIWVKDALNCIATRVITIPSFKVPFVDFPIANSHRVVLQSGPLAKNINQDYDNVLLADMRFPFEKEICAYSQLLLKTDITYQQWRSSYSNHVLQLFKKSDNTLVSTIQCTKQTSYLDKSVANVATLTSGNTGFTQVYFDTALPYYYQVGMDVTISGVAGMNGTYTIKDILPGILLAGAYQVLLLEVAYSPVPTTSACTINAIYNIEEWEVWQATIDWNQYPVDDYYFIITGTDIQFSNFIAESEPVTTALEHPDTKLIECSNSDNAFKMDYSTGIVNRFRITSRIGLPKNAGQITGMEDSTRKYIKLNEYLTRVHDFEVWDIPFYLMEKIQVALAHDTVSINGVRYVTEEKMEVTEFDSEVIMHGRAKIRQYDFENENKTDDSETNSTTMSILSIENAVIDCGAYDATSGLYPSAGGTGYGGAIKRGNWFIVAVASPADVNGDIKFPVGCTMQALVDNPGNIDSNWKVVRA